jgi:hypothetical protein
LTLAPRGAELSRREHGGEVVAGRFLLVDCCGGTGGRFGHPFGVSRAAADRVLEQVRAGGGQARAQLAEIDVRLLGVALSVRHRYQDMDLDLADAVNVALAARYETDILPTQARRDFRARLPLGRHRAFRLLPDDQ